MIFGSCGRLDVSAFKRRDRPTADVAAQELRRELLRPSHQRRLREKRMSDGVRLRLQNPAETKSDACGLFGILDTSGRPMSSNDVVRAMANMHDRSNGLGGGFAVYGLYPEHADLYAFHIMYMRDDARAEAESILRAHFTIASAEQVPTRPGARVSDPPDFWRYFVSPQGDHQTSSVTTSSTVCGTTGVRSFVFQRQRQPSSRASDIPRMG
jgi:hypothetical protein